MIALRVMVLPVALLCCAAMGTKVDAGQSHTAPVTRIVVDAGLNQHPISPLIYGVNYGSAKALADLGATVNRSGGDSAAVYNWELNARNSGQDWFYESVACSKDVMEQYSDGFVQMTHEGGARAMLTVPMMGWVAKLGPNRSRLAGFSITKYGLQRKTDAQSFSEAGDGFKLDGQPITNNDPNDAMQQETPEYEARWLRQLVARWKRAAAGGVMFYLMDNEPGRWHEIHRDVHPQGSHASEILQKSLATSAMVRSVDPTAKVMGPEEWIPPGYRDSGFDQQRREKKDTSSAPDRVAETGGMDYLPWLLTQWKKAGHPVDVVSVHFYPQSGEYRDASEDTSEQMQMLRNKSTRLLWDSVYQDTSWMMGGKIALIPNLRATVDRYYHPGTPIAITEYNWGGEKTMNGATTEADILGIFGRENLYLATRWAAPTEGSPTYLAMKMFRNYDGRHGGFGETSISAVAPDVDAVSVFAALRAQDKAMTIMVINKQLTKAAPVDVSLARFGGEGTVETIQLANGKLATLPSAPYHNKSIQTVLPPQSVTLMIVHPYAS